MTTPLLITSRQNPRVKEAVRLRTGRERQRSGRFLIDGLREIERALAAGIRPIEAFVCETHDGSHVAAVIAGLRKSGAELLPVTADVFERLCFGKRDEVGIVVVAETPTRRLTDLSLSAEPLVAVVEGIEKPGNLGAIVRSADAAAVDAVVVADGQTDLFNPNAIRASLGTVFQPNVVEASTADTLEWLKEHRLTIVAARPDAEILYTEVDLRGPTALVLGSEAHGFSAAWDSEITTPIRLPMHGLADSLNVSTTAAVLFYEAFRQRSAARQA
jgi:TrmH family RNA methyltransferase